LGARRFDGSHGMASHQAAATALDTGDDRRPFGVGAERHRGLASRLLSTSSSEAAFPKMIEQLMRFGVSERIAGFVLPLGYSFNLDGSMMYQTFAALFVAQAFGIELDITTQITMLLVLMVSTKGIAGVPRASLVVVAATLPMFGLPTAGLVLLIGIDQFIDMGRTLTNVIGNGVATAVVAKWENELTAPSTEDDEFVPVEVVH